MAKRFYEKWDEKHLLDLNDNEYLELINDIDEMRNTYKNIYKEENTFKNTSSNFSFYQIKELSMSK